MKKMGIYIEEFGKLLDKKIINKQFTTNTSHVVLRGPKKSASMKEKVTPQISYAFASKHESNIKLCQKLTAYRKIKEDMSLKNIEEEREEDKMSTVTGSCKILDYNERLEEKMEDFLKDLKHNHLCWTNETEKETVLKRRRGIVEGSYPNHSVDEEKLATLLRFVWKGKTEKLDKYFEDRTKYEKINRQDDFGRTALHFAASWGCTKTMEMLLKIPGINLNIKDAHDMTPLFKAAEIKSLECIRLLVENGANVKVTCRDGRNILEYVIQEYGDDCLPIVKYLLNTGQFDERKKNRRTMTSLHKLCFAKKHVSVEEITEVLIAREMDINAVEGKGRTPLMLAVMAKRYDVMRSLLRNFCDVNIYDNRLRSVAYYASKGSYASELLSGCRAENKVRVLRHRNISQIVTANGKSPGNEMLF